MLSLTSKDSLSYETISTNQSKEKIDIKNLPTHIGLIPDGNRRWAKMNNLPYEVGYRKGIENLINFISWIGELKIKYLTVWAFSTENWLRSKDEKELLFELLKQKAEELLKNKDFDKYQIKITFRGEVEKFDKEILEVIDKIQNKTKNFNKYHLTFMLNYGGRKEILEAVKKIARDVKNNKVKEDEIDEALFSKYLLTNDLPDPDLIIRTAEKRLSGFLPWQSVYSELYFSEKLWPDFRKEDLIKALMDYSERERRFGK